MRSLVRVLSLALLFVVAAPSAAHATDTWSQPFPGYEGIAQLYRSIPGQEIHAVFVDISRPELHIRATRPEEAGRTTTSYANLVGAAVAINGDWFNSSGPHGLAVGDGVYWPDSTDENWSFIACTIENTCEIDTSNTDRLPDWRWRDLVGGNGVILASDGQALHNTDSFYSVDRHPRSAIGVSQDGQHLTFVVVEGRRPGANGMTFNEMADLLVELGAWDAMMLDGGGSSSLVVGGTRINDLPSGASERSVGNHFAVVREYTSDPGCQKANGRWCDGNTIWGCQGNTHLESGNCAAFGATCSETGEIGHCVHPFCPAGGNGTACIDATQIATCELGALVGQGDCAAFGASCEADAAGAYCVHYLCSQGGNASWCDGDVAKTCTRGEYVETTCSGDEHCMEGICRTPPDPTEDMAMEEAAADMSDGSGTAADTMQPTGDGTGPDGALPDGAVDPGLLPDAAMLSDTGSAGGGDAAAPAQAGDPSVEGACGCRAATGAPGAPPVGSALALAGLGLLGFAWRRSA